MRKVALIASLAVIMMLFTASTTLAEAPEMSININSGYSFTWVELELEYKTDPFAFGAQVGYGYGLEIGAFGRYYFPLNSYLNIPAEYRLSVFAGITPSLLLDFVPSFGAGFGLKVGPGIDFRWNQLRVYIEGGYMFDTLWGPSHGGYGKAGIGYIF